MVSRVYNQILFANKLNETIQIQKLKHDCADFIVFKLQILCLWIQKVGQIVL